MLNVVLISSLSSYNFSMQTLLWISNGRRVAHTLLHLNAPVIGPLLAIRLDVLISVLCVMLSHCVDIWRHLPQAFFLRVHI